MSLNKDIQTIILPKVIFGTSGLGNLFTALSDEAKMNIVTACVQESAKPVVFDSAGKYGAGLALEALGKGLKALKVNPADVLISNKLGWLRTQLNTPEPTFEPGVWRDLKHDAVQKISYEGILECYEQGNTLLNGYKADLVSVHDPDEYLAAAENTTDKEERYKDVIAAYQALHELKDQGKVKAIGVGSKDWKILQRITRDVDLDWVMIANSMTVNSHPEDLIVFMEELNQKGITIINSAVFNAGFLIGGDYYNYKLMSREHNMSLFIWRDCFFKLCDKFGIEPAEACVAFGLNAPGVKSIALNTTNAKRVKGNIAMANVSVPHGFWDEMKAQGLISKDYTYL
jgi:D-threo-aldose 1-dehydrogenase